MTPLGFFTQKGGILGSGFNLRFYDPLLVWP